VVGDRIVDDVDGLVVATLADLVPADRDAYSSYTRMFGGYDVCPRCDAARLTSHHPKCHTADVVPLYPDFGVEVWRREVLQDPAAWDAWEERVAITTEVWMREWYPELFADDADAEAPAP
jgi:hypothetical protein